MQFLHVFFNLHNPYFQDEGSRDQGKIYMHTFGDRHEKIPFVAGACIFGFAQFGGGALKYAARA